MSWIKNNEWLSSDVDHGIRWRDLRRFTANYRPYRKRLALAAVLMLAGSAPAFLVPMIFYRLQNALLFRDARVLALGLMALLGMSLVQVLTNYGIRIIRSRISTLLNRELVLQYYRKILNLSVEDFIAFRQRTNLFQRVIDGMSITPQFTDVLVRGGQSLVMVLVMGAVMVMLSPVVSAVLAAGGVLLFTYVLLQARQLRVLRQRSLALNYPLVGKMTEIIGGLFTIKALSASVRVTSDITALVEGKTDAEYAESVADVRAGQVAQVIRAVTMVFAGGAGCVLMMNGALNFSDLLALFLLSALVLQPVSELAALYQQLSRLSVNVRNFYEVLDLQDEADEARSGLAARTRQGAGALGAGGPARVRVLAAGGGGPGLSAGAGGAATLAPPAPGRGHVEFQGMTFAYRGGSPILSGIDLEIAPGERISLIGKSGVGKTTLIRLLLGFLQPQEGRILVDGQDVAALSDKNAYRRQFGVVSQNDVLFGVGIRENLLFGMDEGTPDERLEEVLRMVGLWDDVCRLGEGLDTRYSEDLFSGGQKQRFFIARALLRRPSIVLLDEPTSALDFQSEGLVMDAIERLVGGKTTLTIAHRLSTVRSSDRVVVLDAGSIVAAGSHDELYESNDYYRALCEYNSFMV